MKALTLFEFERINIEELGWSRDHPYLDLLERLNESAGDTLINVGRKSIKAAKYVGVIRAGDLTIQILPKIDYLESDVGAERKRPNRQRQEQSALTNLLHMLSYAEDLQLKEERRALTSAMPDDWFELLTYLFARELYTNVLSGPHRDYVRREERLPVMRGKWMISQQLSCHPHERHRFDLAYDEFELNTPLNQVFRYVIEQLLYLSRRAANQRLLLILRATLMDVKLLPSIDASMLDQIQFTRLNERFQTAFSLARLFLKRETLLLSPGCKALYAFVFDMNRLFEDFVWGFLYTHRKRIFPEKPEDIHLQKQAIGTSLHLIRDQANEKEHIRLRPDILLHDSLGRTRLVLDTKYKRLGRDAFKPQVAESDLYQMVAYMTRFDCRQSLLLYPSEVTNGQLRKAYSVPETSKQIGVATLDLHHSLRDINYFVHQFQSILTYLPNLHFREVHHGKTS